MIVSGSMLVLAGIVISGAVLVVLAPFIFRETQRARALDRRLAVPRRDALGAAPGSVDGSGDASLPSLREIGSPLLHLGSILVPIGAKEREKLTRTLRLAGFGRHDALSLFLSCKLVCGLAGGGLGALAAQSMGPMFTFVPSGFLVIFGGVAGLVVGGIAPEYAVRSLVARRRRRMAAALPDALDLMVMCLESGLTFERSLATVADELMPIEKNLAGEFRLIDAELRLGSDRRSVLQAYHERTEVEGLRDFAISLIQGERYGTPLAQSMKNIAAAERAQRVARIAAWAARLPVLMSLPMLLLVVPGTVLLVAGPAFLTAMDAITSLSGAGGGSGGE